LYLIPAFLLPQLRESYAGLDESFHGVSPDAPVTACAGMQLSFVQSLHPPRSFDQLSINIAFRQVKLPCHTPKRSIEENKRIAINLKNEQRTSW